MANKKITDLMSGTPVRDSLLESAIDISGTMDSRKVKAGAVADLANANMAAPYDSTVTYAIGQYCLYEGDIYRCIAITTGAFDSTAWTQIVVTGEFRRVVELTSAQYTALSSAEKNNGTLYIITDEETTAADIPYSQGVSVADKLDSLSTVESVNASVGSYVQNALCKCYRIGKIVQFFIVGEAKNNFGNSSIIATGLPIPKDTDIRYAIIKTSAGSPYVFGTSYQCAIDSSGNLKPMYIPAGGIDAGNYFMISFTYLMA